MRAVRSKMNPEPASVEEDRRRLLIIGLDGATFDVLDPMMQAGRMPRLQGLIESGARGILESTRPPITPAAWTTFLTGKGPGRHGIIDFERYDPHSHALQFNSSQQVREPTLWDILGGQGFRVGSLQMPMSYPVRPVNGFLISGFDTPSTKVAFTWPTELKDAILRQFPDYSYKSQWRRRTFGGDALFAENLDYIRRSFHQGYELAEFCGQRYGWDVLMIMLKLVDNLQHKTWKYLDPQTRGRNPRRAAMTADCFNALDEALGKMFDLADRQGADVLIVSDHGHGSLDGRVHPNLLLRQWGYLGLRGAAERAQTRVNGWLGRLAGRRRVKHAGAMERVERELAVDWATTRACVMHAGMYGFLYVNLAGRQPQGTVPASQYDSLRDEIRDRLLAERMIDRQGREIPTFVAVHRPEELYGCARAENPSLPDLLLEPQPGLAVVRKIRGRRAVSWFPYRRLEGTHRLEGVLMARGSNVRSGARIRARMADVAPTILAWLGVGIPSDMGGQVIGDLFADPVSAEQVSPVAASAGGQEESVLSAKEAEALTARLMDLGYLE
jgi:predicted AlkP superfamily phosphohydrolase/phosphomutase